MPINVHNLTARESGSNRIPGLWQCLPLQGSRHSGPVESFFFLPWIIWRQITKEKKDRTVKEMDILCIADKSNSNCNIIS